MTIDSVASAMPQMLATLQNHEESCLSVVGPSQHQRKVSVKAWPSDPVPPLSKLLGLYRVRQRVTSTQSGG